MAAIDAKSSAGFPVGTNEPTAFAMAACSSAGLVTCKIHHMPYYLQSNNCYTWQLGVMWRAAVCLNKLIYLLLYLRGSQIYIIQSNGHGEID